MTERVQNRQQEATARRLPPRENEPLDREKKLPFTFAGDRYEGHPGDTIASALAAAGVRVFSRSFKYHRPRGLLCCSGHCPNCLVQVGPEPNVRACTRPLEAGMEVEPQNVWPSLERDVMSLTRLGDRFLPVGFYYKSFIRPQALWPVYERILRQAAGLGRVDPETKPGDYDKQYLHPQIAVVGGGPAGMSAALAAADEGARVALFDDNPELGGHLRFTTAPAGEKSLAEWQAELAAHPNVDVYTSTSVLGWWEENWMAAVRDNRLYKIRAEAVVFATGAHEQPLLFDNNDLPGVMLGSGVRRLLHLYRVAPGRRALVVTANDEGWATAADMQAAGIDVVAVADLRLVISSPLVGAVEAAGARTYSSYTILEAAGDGEVERAVIAPVDDWGQVSTGAKETVYCDLIAVSVGRAPENGLLYQAGGRFDFAESRGEFLPGTLPAGIFAAGRVDGANGAELALADGRLAGKRAAAFLELGPPPSPSETTDVARRKQAEGRQTSTLVSVRGEGKQFLCFCEDVTKKDVKDSIAEGYNSIELLKRYSTVSMGPCQGRMCSVNTIHLCARANGWTIEETGTTTARPPSPPVTLGALAGQNMEPVRYTAAHQWHVERGAKMMVAGLWMRPEHYGDPVAEVAAVRHRVGLIDVSTLGKMRLTGPGVPDLLDRIYLNRWQKLGAGRVRYGMMCNDEGIILDDGVTARVGPQEWYMSTTSSGASAIYEWMQWWMQSGWGDGAHLTNVTDAYAAFNLAGPLARTLLQPLTESDLSAEAFPYMHVRDLLLAGIPCRLLRIGFTGELSYEIHCPAGYGMALWEKLMEAGKPLGILPFGIEAQRVLRLEKGHIIVGQDTDALSDPISADMGWLVKFDKGQFLGQRPLVRLDEEGPVQRLVGFQMVGAGIVPEEGRQIVRARPGGDLEIIGWVTSSRYSPTLRESIGLCWLPAGVAGEDGAIFNIRLDNDRLVAGRVHHGPFYDPDGARLRA